MTFTKKNYLLLLAAIALLALGFILLSGGGVEDPTTEFSYDIYSVRRLWVAPIVLILGFTTVGFAIFKRFDK